MNAPLQPAVTAALAALHGPTQHQRPAFESVLGPNAIVLQSVKGFERINGSGYKFDVIGVSVDGHIELKQLTGTPATIAWATDSGQQQAIHGYITAAANLGGDGGLCKYRITLGSFLWFTRLAVRTEQYLDRTVIDIVEQVLARYQGQGQLQPAWRLELADPSVYARRSLTLQYNESDYAFLKRLMADEGLNYHFVFEGTPSDVNGARMVMVISDHNGAFAPNEPIVARYHRADATEATDAVQTVSLSHAIGTAAISNDARDYRAHQQIAGSDAVHDALSALSIKHLPGAYTFEDSAQAARLTRINAQALACQQHRRNGRSTLRQLTVGRSLRVLNHPSLGRDDSGDGRDDILISRIEHHFRSNVPKAEKVLANTTTEAVYANRFQGVPARLTYRGATHDRHGLQLHPKPTVMGAVTGIVTGVQEPIHTDRDHRIKVQLHSLRGSQAMHRLSDPHQDSADSAPASDASGTWMRVLTAVAGANWGSHFVPRVGQEVLIGFIDSDIDRPAVLGAVYNGQGVENAQGNAVATGGSRATGNAPTFFPGTKAEGNLPGHQHSAVTAGLKTQERSASQTGFGGYNTLLFDVTPSEARAWLGTTQAQTHLVAGYLRHQTDNQLLNQRGYGLNAMTQSYGAIRAGAGLLLSTDARPNGSSTQMDSKEADAQLKASAELVKTLADTAQKHNAKLPNEPAPDKLPVADGFAAIGTALAVTETMSGGRAAAPAQEEPETLAIEERLQYDEQVQALDDITGEPLCNMAYFVTAASGKEYKGYTDDQGRMRRIVTDGEEQLTVLWGIAALERMVPAAADDAQDA